MLAPQGDGTGASRTDPAPSAGGSVGDGVIGASTSSGGTGGGAGSSGSSSTTCTWNELNTSFTSQGNIVPTKTVDGVVYHEFVKTCPNPDGTTTSTLVWIPQESPKTLATNAAQRVEQLLPHPTPTTAPPLTEGIVKVGMWFWVDPAQYVAQTVTASIPTATGTLTATTSATPVRMVYSPGEPDGEPVTCPGPGQQWVHDDGDDATSPCMYTYQHSSEIDPNGQFTATLQIVWHITWTSNAGINGDLGEYTTSTTFPITIHEIQAVITNGG
jgi:hypothetical protein